MNKRKNFKQRKHSEKGEHTRNRSPESYGQQIRGEGPRGGITGDGPSILRMRRKGFLKSVAWWQLMSASY